MQAYEIRTLIRVQNVSCYDFADLLIETPGDRQTFGDLGAGQITEYLPFKEAYRYAFVSATIGGQKFALQPIDYVGEERLAPGHYTYAVAVADFSRGLLTMNHIVD